MTDWPEHWHFTFFIAGVPSPGGSKNAFVVTKKDGSVALGKGGRPIVNVTDAGGKKTKEWRKVVAWTAKQKWSAKPIPGPCAVEFIFLMPRPNAHYRTGKNAHLLKDDAPIFHTFAPDGGKLRRSTEDALSGLVYEDDALIVQGAQEKRWCAPGEQPGCIVTVRALKSLSMNTPSQKEPTLGL